MLTSLGLIFLVGLSLAGICEKIKVPRIIGMLITGVVLGPFVLDMFDSSILSISPELRKMALVIILIKAGLSLDLKDLKKVGRPALMLSFVPASFEIIAYAVFAPLIFDVTLSEALVIGAVLSAVSPAVVVPRMVNLIDNKVGTKKGIPQMLLAGSSMDDVFVLVLFTTFVSMASGEEANAFSFLNIPVSIILGVLVGAFVGYCISLVFKHQHDKNKSIRNSVKVLMIVAFSFLLLAVEDLLEDYVAFSGVLAVISMSIVIAMKSYSDVKTGLKDKFGKLWIPAEIILFVLVGAAVDIRYTLKAGIGAVLMIFIALFVRSLGVLLCLVKTKLNFKERLFCVFAYLPKATVQAAIGSVPLAMGLACGNLVLSIAVLAIVITAPLGAFLMDFSYKKLLSDDKEV